MDWWMRLVEKYEFKRLALALSELATVSSRDKLVGIDCLLLFKNLIAFQNFFGFLGFKV